MNKKEKDIKKIEEFVERFRKLDDSALKKRLDIALSNGFAHQAINIVLKERELK